VFAGKAICSQRLVLSVSLDGVTEVDGDKEMGSAEKAKSRRRRARARYRRGSRSHGGPLELVVKVAHFP